MVAPPFACQRRYRCNTTLQFQYGVVGGMKKYQTSSRHILHMQVPFEPGAVSPAQHVRAGWYTGNATAVVFPWQLNGVTQRLRFLIDGEDAVGAQRVIAAPDQQVHVTLRCQLSLPYRA